MHFNQFQQHTPLPFQPMNLEQGQKSSRTVQFYDRIDNLLKQSSQSTLFVQSQTKIKILEQLQMFHQFYKQRHQQLKQNYEVLNKVNWQYANQILQYEVKIKVSQNNLKEQSEKLQKMQQEVRKINDSKKQMQQMYQQKINEKQKELREIRNNMNREFNLNDLKRKKVLRIRQDKQNLQKHQTIEKIQNTKIIKQYLLLKQKNHQLVLENEELNKQNQLTRKKLKHLQADRKYQDQRLKNATLALQLDLKLKNKQIERLTQQVNIYQIKFQQFLLASNSSNSVKYKFPLDSQNYGNFPSTSSNLNSNTNTNCQLTNNNSQVSYTNKNCQVTNTHKNSQVTNTNTNSNTVINSQVIEKNQLSKQKKKFLKMFQNHKYQQKTYRKLDMPNSARGHKRHGSATLDNNQVKDDLDMKIRIIRYNKSKNKI